MRRVTYVIVHDVPATWEQYDQSLRPLVEPPPEGLILHAAGKTDEGYRTVDVWESERAWERFRERLPSGPADGALATETQSRAFSPQHVVVAADALDVPVSEKGTIVQKGES